MPREDFPVKPLGDRVVIERLEETAETTPGGIVIPDSAKERPQLGRVVSVGPGRTLENGKLVEVGVKPGDRVFHSKYGGTEVKIEGKEYLILREEDILAIYRK